MANSKPIPKTMIPFDVFLWQDGADEPVHHYVPLGTGERIKAKRHFNKPLAQLFEEADEETFAYLAYLGMQRHHDWDGDFDEFLDVLAEVNLEVDGTDLDADPGDAGDGDG